MVLLVIVLLSTLALQAQADGEALIEVERLSDRALALRVGVTYFDQIVAIASSRGLVVIDAGISPSITEEYRKIIEREFGRKDFAYVINTHHHSDHTSGNQTFADAVIIGHELCGDAMRQEGTRIADKIAKRKAKVDELEDQLGSLEPGSDQARQVRSTIYFLAKAYEDLEGDFALTPPSMTFSDRMTLNMGDLTLKLIFFGKGLHTDNDIVVHIPEEGLLFTGDLFPFPPGRTPAASPEEDLPRWIDVLEEVLQDESEVRQVITSHFGILPWERLSTLLNELRE
jgi:glyoxylase-like metal-dependent hydrolase (beta-lactamase superfamily II)